jgi:hypothetical protein
LYWHIGGSCGEGAADLAIRRAVRLVLTALECLPGGWKPTLGNC